MIIMYVENVVQVFQVYRGGAMFLSVFLACVIYGFCYGSETRRKRLVFIFILGILFVFNEISLKIIGKLTDVSTYYRFIWAIPILPVIAWAGTKAVTERKKRWEKAAVFFLLCLFLCSGRSTFLTEGSVRIPENIYNLPNDVIQVCDIIEKDKDKERPVVAFDFECQMSARQYDPLLVWAISRKAYQNYDNIEGYENVRKRYRAEKALMNAVNHGNKDEKKRLLRALRKRNVDYIVTLNVYEMDDYLAQIGYELVDHTEARSVYARTENMEVHQ